MPNKIEKLPDGNLEVVLETGEVFKGDPLSVTEKMAEAHVSTKRWGQEWKSKAETSSNAAPPNGGGQPPAPTDPQEAQLQTYLLTQTAKALGYNNAEEYKADLQKVRRTTEEISNNMVASAFMAQAPDFPNTPEAIDALSKKIDEMKWGFDPQSMIAAHSLLVREHASDPKKGYAPLTIEQQNQAWQEGLQASNRRQAPPPMVGSQSPDGSNQGYNPWDTKAVPLEQLRAAAIRQELEGK